VKTWKVPPKTASSGKPIWDQMAAIKPVFLEVKSTEIGVSKSGPGPTTAESTLSAYTNAVTTGNGRGALLFAVIGGTLSEGINFSDALGRGVAVVGLPFPNPHSAEWKAKIKHISDKAAAAEGHQAGKAAARDYYENVCMRSVNQAIGRAIRHRGDYAAIMLLDRRYAGENIRAKLPGWIKSSLRLGEDMSGTVKALETFFRGKTSGTPMTAP